MLISQTNSKIDGVNEKVDVGTENEENQSENDDSGSIDIPHEVTASVVISTKLIN